MSCLPNDQVLRALLHSAKQIGDRSRAKYMAQIKRDRKGNVTQGYRLSEAHEDVMKTIDAYSRCKLSDNAAMAKLHEYDVTKARFGGLRKSKRRRRRR